MIKIRNSLPLLFILFYNNMYTQTLSGYIINANTKEPISFVNIGLANKKNGTVSNEKGVYNLSNTSLTKDDTVIISSIGYERKLITYTTLANNTTITLTPKSYQLNEVVVKPVALNKKTSLGKINTKQKGTSFLSFLENLGIEYAAKFNVKSNSLLSQLKLNICETSFDTLYMRLKIYQYRADGNHQLLNNKDIYLQYSKANTQNTIIENLKYENIYVQGEVLIALEFYKQMGKGSIQFCSDTKGDGFIRATSQKNWDIYDKIRFGIGIEVLSEE